MSKRRGPDDRRKLDPEDVLAGRVKPGAADLLDLIHRVNPTGRDLPAREAELRYAQKSRLQSLLVRRFGPEIDVVADPEQEGTVSLHHRGHGRDGCHAVVDTLDEDARAWVRLQLDLGPPSSESPSALLPPPRPSGRGLPPPPAEDDGSPPSTEATPESLVRRAAEAVEAYDYEQARARLERALAASGGAAGPAAALLALLVETLGDDAGALSLQASALSRGALADPDVRALLALAAARTGDAGQALALLRGASERGVAEVVAALAAGAVSAGDADRAAGHLAELRRRDPAHPAIAGLGGEIARLRAAERGPIEAELAALVAAGQESEAEKKAAEVLARWPESETARRVLRAAEERRRIEQEAAERRAREADAAQRQRREAERATQVQTLLAAADPREGLAAFLSLGPELRRQVHAPEAAELVRWLEQTPARVTTRARVEAVIALAGARRCLPGEPQEALDALAPHEVALERVPEARRVAQEAHAALGARRAAQARDEVRAARRDLAGGDAAAALVRLETTVLRDLGEGERAEAEALRAEATRIVARERRVAEVGRLRQIGHLFEARALAEELGSEATGDERARWEEERRALQASIQRACLVEVDREVRPFGDGPRPDATQPWMDAPTWLTGDGRTLVLVEGKERWVWIQLVDVDARTALAEVLLRAPEPMGTVICHVLGRTAWLTGERGPLLAFDVDLLEVTHFRRASEMLPRGVSTGGATIAADRDAPAPRYYWNMPADAEGYGGPVQVIDLETRRVVREVPDVVRFAAIPGTREARVACFKQNGLNLHEGRGALVPGARFKRQGVAVLMATLHPSGEGLVAAGFPADDRARSREMYLLDLPPEGPAPPSWATDVSPGNTILALASARDTGLVALVCLSPDRSWKLLVLRPAGGGAFELLHRSEVPDTPALVRDAGARRLFLYYDDPFFFAPLGATSPDLPPFDTQARWISDVSHLPACIGSSGARAAVYQGMRDALKGQPRAAHVALCRSLEDRPDALVERVRCLLGTDPTGEAEAERVRAWLWGRYPEVPSVRLLRADELAQEDRWREVREVLAPCSAASFAGDEEHAQHFFHLLARAAFQLGDGDEARARVADAGRYRGACNLRALAEVLLPRPGPEAREDEGAPAPAHLTELVWAIHDADALLDAGDAEGALAALDPGRFYVDAEVQALARRAEAWLRLETRPEWSRRQRFAKIMALARLVDAHQGDPDGSRQELLLPGATWERGRIDDLTRRASAWLDAQGGEGEGSGARGDQAGRG